MLVVEDIKENEDLLLDKTNGDCQELLPPRVLETFIEHEITKEAIKIEKAIDYMYKKIVLSNGWNTFKIPIYTHIED